MTRIPSCCAFAFLICASLCAGASQQSPSKNRASIVIDPKVASLVRNGVAALKAKHYDQALSSFTAALNMSPKKDSASVIYNLRAEAYLLKGELNAALDDANESIRLNPGLAGGYVERGTAYRRKGEREKAMNDFDNAIRLNPQFFAGYLGRGVVYRELGDYDEAIKLYNKAIQLNPNYAPAYYDRALAYSYKHEFERAIRDSDEAIRRDPGDASAFYNRGADYETIGNLDKALADYSAAINLKPTDAAAYYRRAHTYERLEKFDKAISDYDQAIRINPQDAEGYATRGNAYFAKGNYKEALSNLTKAVDLTSSNYYALTGLAWVEATCPEDSLRNGKEALRRGLKACELTKWQEAGTLDTLAAAYAELGDFNQAIKYQLQAKDMTRGNVFERKEMEERLALYNEHKPYRDKSKLTRR